MFFHIIDDEPFICFFISEMLSDMGHETETFSSSLQYLDYLDSPDYSAPTAVFSDLSMPFVDGYQLADRVLSHHPDSYFVMMSGASGIKSEYKKDGCIFLHKPFHLKDLENTVASMGMPINAVCQV